MKPWLKFMVLIAGLGLLTKCSDDRPVVFDGPVIVIGVDTFWSAFLGVAGMDGLRRLRSFGYVH